MRLVKQKMHSSLAGVNHRGSGCSCGMVACCLAERVWEGG
jgi:hypothetical protein